MRLLRPIGALLIVLIGGFLLQQQAGHIPQIGSSIKNLSFNFTPSNIENNSSDFFTKIAEDIKGNLPPPLDFLPGGGTSTGGSNSGGSAAGGAALSVSGVINVTNQERAANGNLPPLRENAKLDAAAAAKVKDMFSNQYFEHTSPSGVGPADLAKTEGYAYILIGENLALGDFKNNQALLDAWMNSPGHRANILNSRYSEMGAAVSMGIYKGEKVWLAVQEFGLALSACPSPDPLLEAKINSEKSDLDAQDAALAAKKADIDNSSPKYGDAYNAKVTEYNNMVADYNSEVKQTKADVDTYNAEVRAFNSCVNS